MTLRSLDPKLAENNVLVFDCPCGKCGGRVRVPLAPSVGDCQWQHTGEFPDTLTLSPSVNAGCWHGHIVNGEIVS